MDLSNQNIKKTNKSFNESWTQGKKLKRNGKKERMSPHSLTLLTSCNLDYSSCTRDAKMLILGNPSIKLNPRYACKNARTLGDYLWIPMISFRGRAKRERETTGFTTLQETRNNRRPSRIKQRLDKKGDSKGGPNVRTYVCTVIVRFLSRRSSQICRVVKVKCLPHPPPSPVNKPYSSTVELKGRPCPSSPSTRLFLLQDGKRTRGHA